jgi:hypothetical protein
MDGMLDGCEPLGRAFGMLVYPALFWLGIGKLLGLYPTFVAGTPPPPIAG